MITREFALEQFNGAQGQVELIDVVLAEVPDPQMATVVPQAGRRVQFASQNLQQCRLTRTVFTDLIKKYQ